MKTSLIVCSRNRAPQLRTMLSRLDLAEMKAFGVELVLVDSASDDETPQVMVEFARSCGIKAQVFRAPRKGLGFARNIGVEHATGDLLCFTDDDCYLGPGYFSAVTEAFGSGQVQYGMGRILHFDPRDDQRLAGAKIDQTSLIPPGTMLPTGTIQGANMFFQREVFTQAGLFRADMGAGTEFACEDIEMGLRASIAGFTGVLLPSAIVFHHHGRRANSPEALATMNEYDRGRGAYYASALASGYSDVWLLWCATTPSRQSLPADVLRKLEREFRGAADWMAHAAQAAEAEPAPPAREEAADSPPAPQSSMPGTLWVRAADAARLGAQSMTPLLIGGYDGSRNYGDLLQCVAAASSYQMVGEGLLVGIVGKVGAFAPMVEDVRKGFPKNAVPVFFSESRSAEGRPDLVPLPPTSGLSLHFYGGGYINDNWGRDRRKMGEAALALCAASASPRLPEVIFTGIQVSPGAEAEAWRPWFDAALSIGVRDQQSGDIVRSIMAPERAERVVFAGDDALYALLCAVPARSPGSRRIGIHVSRAEYSTANRQARVEQIAALVVKRAGSGPLSCDFLIAYPDDHVDETGAADEVHQAILSRLPAGMQSEFRVRDLYAEALTQPTIEMDYDLVVSCSYHIALTGLAAGCPVVLLAENSYYGQKVAGLFDQDPGAQLHLLTPGAALPDIHPSVQGSSDLKQLGLAQHQAAFRAVAAALGGRRQAA
ncbi:MAG TPA: glycosyltransferase [Microvirga sp.]|jgi:GT2 family glycosyltransferase